MLIRRISYFILLSSSVLLLFVSGTGCNTTKHLKEGEYLLRANTVKVKSNELVTQKGVLRDNLGRLVVQKPNKYNFGFIPIKLLLYNSRYEKYQADSANFQLQSKTVEPPVIYDSSLRKKSVLNMKGYLFHEGYFYSEIKDTVTFKDKKAYVTYDVNTGTNYLINEVTYDIPDSTMKAAVLAATGNSTLQEGVEFSYNLLEQEQSRIRGLLLEHGYYKFSNDNVSFVLDTLNKQYLRNIENPFESAINFIALQKNQKKPTLNIRTIIHAEDSSVFYKYAISRVRVFPDYEGSQDFRDTTMMETRVNNVIFRYNNMYVNPTVIQRHIFLTPNTYYSQRNYDQTITRLNELGIFQSVRITFRDDTSRGPGWMSCNIFLSPTEKLGFNSNLEASSGTTYTLGSAVTVGFKNRNFAKGANLLSITATGSVETQFDTTDNPLLQRFYVLTKSVGVNASLEFPKFLIPVAQNKISPRNAPRTVLSTGWNLLDRVNYFTLANTSASFTYRWRETETKSWEVSPAFVNIIDLRYISPSFQERLNSSEYLKNSYKDVFIEGENVAFTFTDREKKNWKNYNYLKLSAEESGILISTLNAVFNTASYAQYVKFDFDLQRFFNYTHSTVALRLWGGVGIPYDKSQTLPYVKQYFAGGPYSIRGWRIRTLGPGSYHDTVSISQNQIDRTGDMKLEMNGEYRFDIVKLFSGVVKMNGAVFIDAGNIWLAKPSADYPGGEFRLDKFGSDIAVSTGAGLRFDAGGFFVIRIDVGMPVRKPDFISSGGWVFDEVNFSDRTWRKENLIPSVSIGYPF